MRGSSPFLLERDRCVKARGGCKCDAWFAPPAPSAETLASLQRALDGAYKARCNRRIVQSDRNARPDSRNLVAGRLCHLHTSSEKSYDTSSPPCSLSLRDQSKSKYTPRQALLGQGPNSIDQAHGQLEVWSLDLPKSACSNVPLRDVSISCLLSARL